jgi:adenylylsulfate kinase
MPVSEITTFDIKKERLNCVRHQGILIWFTGLSGSGKSSIAHEVENRLFRMQAKTYVLDGDVLRQGINSDLGFSIDDRNEHVRRVGEISKMFVDAGVITLVSLISPFSKNRDKVRSMFSNQDFIEVYCRCPIVECIRRDVKGLYEKAKSGEIKDFTGVSSPYEEPLNPDLLLDTCSQTFEESVGAVMSLLEKRNLFTKVRLMG